jgi:hypothetical protein
MVGDPRKAGGGGQIGDIRFPGSSNCARDGEGERGGIWAVARKERGIETGGKQKLNKRPGPRMENE